MKLQSTIFVLLFVSLSTFAFGETAITKTIQLDKFTGINLMGHYQVYLKQGSKQVVKVEATQEFITQLNKKVKNGIWSIKTNNWKWNKKQKKVKVYITIPTITQLTIAGSGNIYSETDLNVQDLKVKLMGSGNIKATVNGTHLKSTITGSGNILLKGKIGSISHMTTGSGNLMATGLKVKEANIRITGSGNSKLYILDNLTAKIMGSGNIYYRGNPAVSKSIKGSGRVRKS